MRRDLGKKNKILFFGVKIVPVYFNFPPPQKSRGLKTDVPRQKKHAGTFKFAITLPTAGESQAIIGLLD